MHPFELCASLSASSRSMPQLTTSQNVLIRAREGGLEQTD